MSKRPLVRATSGSCLALVLACVSWAPPASSPSQTSTTPFATEPYRAALDLGTDQVGVGWRIRGGRLETVHERLRVTPTRGWELALAEASEEHALHSSFLLYHAVDDVVLAFQAPVGSWTEANDAPWLAVFDDGGGQPTTPETALLVDWLGEPIEFVQLAHAGEGGAAKRYRGTSVIDGQTLAIVVDAPDRLDREQLRVRISEALAAVQPFDAGELEALVTELAEVPDRRDILGTDWSVRRGVYRHFGHDFTWTLPRGFWLVSTGDEALAPLRLANPSEDVQIAVSARHLDPPGATLEQVHEQSVASMTSLGLIRSGKEHRRAGDTNAVVERLDVAGAPDRVHLVEVLHGDSHIEMLIHVARDQDRAPIDGLIDELIDGLQLEQGLEPMQFVDGRMIDLRSGFAIDMPGGGEPELTEYAGETGRGYLAKWGANIMLLALNSHGLAYSGQELLDGSIARFRAELSMGDPSSAEATLAGLPAQHLTWISDGTELNAVFCVRDRTVFMLAVLGPDRRVFEQLRESFEFFD